MLNVHQLVSNFVISFGAGQVMLSWLIRAFLLKKKEEEEEEEEEKEKESD